MVVYQLQADVRDVESAALTMSKGIDAPGLRERLGKAKEIPQRLQRLAELTRDNPEQLVRIGRIQSMVERRMEVARQLAKTSPNSDQRELVQDLTTRYPIRGLIEELQASEEKLLAQRTATFQKQQRQGEFISWTALALSLIHI